MQKRTWALARLGGLVAAAALLAGAWLLFRKSNRHLPAHTIEEKRAAAPARITPRSWPGAQHLVILETVPAKGSSDPSPEGHLWIPGSMSMVLRADCVADFVRPLATDKKGYPRPRGVSYVPEDMPTPGLPAWAQGEALEAAPAVVRLFLQATASAAARAHGDQAALLHFVFRTMDGGESFFLTEAYTYGALRPGQGSPLCHPLRIMDNEWADRIGCDPREWIAHRRMERLQRIVEAVGIQALLENTGDTQLVEDFPINAPASGTWRWTDAQSERMLLAARNVACGDALVPCWELASIDRPRHAYRGDPCKVGRHYVAPGIGPILEMRAGLDPDQAEDLWDEPNILPHRTSGGALEEASCLRLICVPADEVLWYAGDEPDAGWKAWKLGPPEQDPALVR